MVSVSWHVIIIIVTANEQNLINDIPVVSLPSRLSHVHLFISVLTFQSQCPHTAEDNVKTYTVSYSRSQEM